MGRGDPDGDAGGGVSFQPRTEWEAAVYSAHVGTQGLDIDFPVINTVRFRCNGREDTVNCVCYNHPRYKAKLAHIINICVQYVLGDRLK